MKCNNRRIPPGSAYIDAQPPSGSGTTVGAQKLVRGASKAYSETNIQPKGSRRPLSTLTDLQQVALQTLGNLNSGDSASLEATNNPKTDQISWKEDYMMPTEPNLSCFPAIGASNFVARRCSACPS